MIPAEAYVPTTELRISLARSGMTFNVLSARAEILRSYILACILEERKEALSMTKQEHTRIFNVC